MYCELNSRFCSFVSLLVVNHRGDDIISNERFNSICPLTTSSDISLRDKSILVRSSKQRLNCFWGARCLSCKSVKGLLSVGWDVGGGSFVIFSIGGAIAEVRWRAFVLLATLWFSVSSSEDITTRVGAMLSCWLLDCTLLYCDSVSEAESELSGAGSRARVWGYRVGGAMLAASVA